MTCDMKNSISWQHYSHACMHSHTHTRTRTHLHTYTHTHIHTHTHAHTHLSLPDVENARILLRSSTVLSHNVQVHGPVPQSRAGSSGLTHTACLQWREGEGMEVGSLYNAELCVALRDLHHNCVTLRHNCVTLCHPMSKLCYIASTSVTIVSLCITCVTIVSYRIMLCHYILL